MSDFMDEEFELPVGYKGKQMLLKASLLIVGYTHKFIVDVNGQDIIFEPDEERNQRAVLSYDDMDSNKNIDVELLRTISKTIEELIK